MQTSGIAPNFSDGVRKTIVGAAPSRKALPAKAATSKRVDRLTPGDLYDKPGAKKAPSKTALKRASSDPREGTPRDAREDTKAAARSNPHQRGGQAKHAKGR